MVWMPFTRGVAQESGGVEAPPAPAPPASAPASGGIPYPGSPAAGSPAGNPAAGNVPMRALPTAEPPAASPTIPPAAGFATQDGVPGGPVMTLPPVATPVQPASPAQPTGPTVSAMQAIGRIIENTRPERVKVFPDDPESAWWEINPHYAFARAQREQKPMLLLFTGMWNTQAMSLSEEVFATKSFNEYVKENLIICYLSYPRNITDAPDVLRRLKEKFKVRGYPNVLVFNPNGEVERGIRGYRTGRPIDYFNELRNTCYPVLESIKAQKKNLVRYGYRDWSNYLGKVIFAKFVDRDAVHARLQDVSGVKWVIKINELAPEDQKLVESFPARETLQPVDEEGKDP